MPVPSRPVPLPGRKVVVVGDVINDILVKPGGPVTVGSDTVSVITASPGGSAASQAAWLARLGVDVTFAGRCGARDADYHRRVLEAYGVRAAIAADEAADTGTIVIMVSPDGERTMFTDRGANLRLSRADLPAGLLDGAAGLHLTGYTFFSTPLRAVARELLAEARSRGVVVTIDPGSAAFLAGLAPGQFLRWTAGAALCFPNHDEARVLTGAVPPAGGDPGELAGRLARHYGAVAVKLGGGGCVLAVRGEQPVRIAARAADVVDTTGAGDAFCAAFLARWLGAGAGTDLAVLTAAAAFAVEVAATAVTMLGGRPASAHVDPAK